MNERIARLRTKNLTQQPEICSERAQIVTRAYEKYKDLPPLLLRAKTFEAIMQEMTIWIADDELIVGNQAKMAKGAPVYPEFSVDWIIKELDSFSTRTSSRFLLSEENKTVLRELLPKWQGRTTKDRALSIIPEAAKEAMASQAFLLSPLSSGLGHISVSYQKLIDHGIDFLLDEIRKKFDLSILMTTHDFTMLEQYCDQVVLLQGKILRRGTPLDVLSSDEFAKAFHMGGGAQA